MISFYEDGQDALQTPTVANDEITIDFSWLQEDEKLITDHRHNIPRLANKSNPRHWKHIRCLTVQLDEERDMKPRRLLSAYRASVLAVQWPY